MRVMDRSNCIGCEDNFYNGNNLLGIKECWHFKDAKVVMRFCIGVNVPQDRKENFAEVEVPSCYFSTCGLVYYNGLPRHLR